MLEEGTASKINSKEKHEKKNENFIHEQAKIENLEVRKSSFNVDFDSKKEVVSDFFSFQVKTQHKCNQVINSDNQLNSLNKNKNLENFQNQQLKDKDKEEFEFNRKINKSLHSRGHDTVNESEILLQENPKDFNISLAEEQNIIHISQNQKNEDLLKKESVNMLNVEEEKITSINLEIENQSTNETNLNKEKNDDQKNISYNNKLFDTDSIKKFNSIFIDDYLKIKDLEISDENNLYSQSKMKDTLLKFKEDMETNPDVQDRIEKCLEFYKNSLLFQENFNFYKIGEIEIFEKYMQRNKIEVFKLLNYNKELYFTFKNNLFLFRNVMGDGNCFYRAIIFSYLENLILTKNPYLILYLLYDFNQTLKDEKNKELFNKHKLKKENTIIGLYLVYKILVDRFNIDFTNNKYCKQPNDSKDQSKKENLETNNTPNIDIQDHDLNSFSPLNFLIILFNNDKLFDLGLIMYLRIKIKDFIQENKDKIYSKDFGVKLGNLLPEEYEIDFDKFDWEGFFSENLLKLYSEAENIIIYVIPFILKVNLKIYTHEIGNTIQERLKEFNCYLPKKQTISLFYRKMHYEIVYSKELCDNYKDEINYNYSNMVTILSALTEEKCLSKSLYESKDFLQYDIFESNKIASFRNSMADSELQLIKNMIDNPKEKELEINLNYRNISEEKIKLEYNKNEYKGEQNIEQKNSNFIKNKIGINNYENVDSDKNCLNNKNINKNSENKNFINDKAQKEDNYIGIFNKNNTSINKVNSSDLLSSNKNDTPVNKNYQFCFACKQEIPYFINENKKEKEFSFYFLLLQGTNSTICTDCVEKEFLSSLTAKYLEELYNKLDYFLDQHEEFRTIIQRSKIDPKCSSDIYGSNVKSFINQIKVKFNDYSDEILYSQIKDLLKNKSEIENFNKIKSNFCLFCANSLENLEKDQIINMPCKCCFCSRICQFKYFEKYTKCKKFNLKEFNYNYFCLCGFKYNIRQLFSMVGNLINRDWIKDEKLNKNNKSSIQKIKYCEDLRDFFKKYFNNSIRKILDNVCFQCGCNLNEDKKNIKVFIENNFTTERILDFDLYHFSCYSCVYKQLTKIVDINEKTYKDQNIFEIIKNFIEKSEMLCDLCTDQHIITEVAHNEYLINLHKDDNCMIF